MSEDISALIAEEFGVDHVAYATRNTDSTLKLFSLLGFETVIYKKEIVPLNIYATKMKNSKGDVLELVESLDISKRSPIDEVLKNEDCCIYHICFRVNDFYKTHKEMKNKGALVLTKPFESYLFEGYMVSHMYHPSLGMFEIFGCKRSELL
ncbi:hypothetical protein EXT48_06390 [Pseudoalteromonas sp. CO348]|uniref:VOC family protein n=1 Tax=unclassified Pseudoalteromonas TaxID=194690 RepID=UPI0010239692|nr:MULTISPECIES: VOC family protein [unclassified Pseudoalteromonas]MCG7540025.1 VOC family protein [Pseudoalteromonas sp. OF7H-1]RZG07241.1 hypothetical protein EXT48_06390 [Pseudoalteromonas sp. CO348]